MMFAPLPQLVRRHCDATKPALSLEGLVNEAYGISGRHFRRIVTGKSDAPSRFLVRLNNYHVRLFPNEPVLLLLPNDLPPIVLGDPTNLNTSN